MANKNRFARFFKKNMSSLEVRGVYFSLIDGLSDAEKEELESVYQPAFEKASRRELDMAEKGWLFGG